MKYLSLVAAALIGGLSVANGGTAQVTYDTFTHQVTKPPTSAGASFDLNFTGLTLGGISGGGGTPGGSAKAIQFNDTTFGGDNDFIWDKTTNLETITNAPGANTVATNLLLQNTTTATSGNQQYPPFLQWTGQGFLTGTGSQTSDWRAGFVSIDITDALSQPKSEFHIDHRQNGGSWLTRFRMDSTGNITPGDGDASILFATVKGLDWIGVGGDASHPETGGWQASGIFSGPGEGGIRFNSGSMIMWGSSGPRYDAGSPDIGMSRSGAGILGVTSGASIAEGGTYRDIHLRNLLSDNTLQMTPLASAPGSPSEGWIYAATDHKLYYRTNTAWVDLTATGSATPGGSSGQLQWNSSSAFAGISTLTTDGTIVTQKVGTNYVLADPTSPTKKAQFDASNITAGQTRTVNIPDANSTTIQADTGSANNFLTAVSAQGVISKAQPAFSNISGTATNAQLPTTISSKTHDDTNTYTVKDGANFVMENATTTTKKAQLDLSNITAGQTRTINIPDANSTTAQAKSAVATNFLTAMSAQGVFTAAQPAFTDISGTATNGQLPTTISSKTFDDTNSYTAKDGSFTLENTASTTKKAIFGLSNITAGQTRTVNIPDANSTTIQADTGSANNFLTAVSAQGVISKAQPAFSNLSGNWTLAQGPTETLSTLLGRGSTGNGVPQEITLGSGLSMSGTTLSVSAGGGNVSNSGTPTSGQVAIWQTASTIAGITPTSPLASTSSSLTLDRTVDFNFLVGQTITINDANTNSVAYPSFLAHNTTGTPAIGLGTGLEFTGETSTTVSQPMGTIETAWSTVTDASRTAYMDFLLVNNAATAASKMRLFPSGGLSVNSTTDPGAGQINANTGFKVANAALNFSHLAGNWTLAQGPSTTASTLLGRTSASAGIPQEITLGTNLSMSGTTLNAAGGSGSPGGSDTYIQYNKTGGFFGDANFVWDYTNLKATLLGTPAANTFADGWILTDTTAATSGNQQFSPGLRFTGQGWKTDATAASQAVDWRIYNKPVQGTANPSSRLEFESQVNAGGYTEQFGMTSGGQLQARVQTGLPAVPAYSFVGRTDGGLMPNDWAGGGIGIAVSGNEVFAVTSAGNGTIATGSGGINFSSSATDVTGSQDLGIKRNAAATAEVDNGNAGQWGSLLVGVRDAGTTTQTTGLTIGHQSTGTPAAGLGSALLFNVNDSTTADVNAGRIDARWTTATHNSNVSDIVFQNTNGSTTLAEAARISGAGYVDAKTGFKINGTDQISATQTLTNKRINPRVDSSTAGNATTWAANSDTTDIFELSGTLTVAVTTISNPSGTPVEGQKLMFRIKSDASAHALTWSGTQWRASGATGAPALPTTTTASKNLYVGFVWNSTDSKWDLLAVQDGF